MSSEQVSLRMSRQTVLAMRKKMRLNTYRTFITSHINSFMGKEDNVVLADALNLLSPNENEKPQNSRLGDTSASVTSNYRPSLLSNLRGSETGPDELVSEPGLGKYFKGLELLESHKNQTSVQEHLDHLLAGINFVSQPNSNEKSSYELLNTSPKELLSYIRRLSTEQSIIQVFETFYYQNALTPKITMDLFLNKNVVDLNKFPIKLNKISSDDVCFKSWTHLDFLHVNIVLLKKFHDLKQPLQIIKNLQENFELQYLPSIKTGTLTPFYERIVWKFYFDYLLLLEANQEKSEEFYIKSLNRLNSTFLIWESSIRRSTEIVQFALDHHKRELNPLQLAFLKLVGSRLTRDVIDQELAASSPLNPKSRTLSKLKQMSIKYKIYGFPNITSNESLSIETRSVLYLFINAMESIILDEFVTREGLLEADSVLEIMQLFKDIKMYKETELMNIKPGESNDGGDWTKLFVAVEKLRKI